MATVTAVGAGNATITITASDAPGTGTATQNWAVTVAAAPTPPPGPTVYELVFTDADDAALSMLEVNEGSGTEGASYMVGLSHNPTADVTRSRLSECVEGLTGSPSYATLTATIGASTSHADDRRDGRLPQQSSGHGIRERSLHDFGTS